MEELEPETERPLVPVVVIKDELSPVKTLGK